MGFCPKCGKDIEQGKTFCEEHAPKGIDWNTFDFRLCACGRVFANNHWFTPNSPEETLLKHAKEYIKQKVQLEVNTFEEPEKKGRKTKGLLIATYEGEEYKIPFDVKKQQCDKCSKLGTHYFTAILQLRNPPQEALPFIEEFLKPKMEQGVSINKIEDTPRGPDLYMTHKGVTRQLGEKLVRKFGGVFNQSEQLFSRNKQTSKNLYRLNVHVEFPNFSVGDVILYEERVALVTGLGKQCTARDLTRDKKIVFTAGKEEKVLKKEKTTVAQLRPHITVLHPSTYQPVQPANYEQLQKKYAEGQNVKVILANNRLYLL